MSKKFIIGIDLGGTNLKIALIDLKYNIKNAQVLNTRGFCTKESLIQALISSVGLIIKSNGLIKDDILSLGMGLPGPIDNRLGIVRFFPNIPGWENVAFKRVLESKLNLPVFLDNDAKVMCLAEYTLGSARGCKNAICLTLGTGVGGGIIIDGRIYRGVSNAAGELGHLPINEVGPKCNCGGTACLESYVGNSRILKEAKRLLGKNITLEKAGELAKKGDSKAKILWYNVGTYLGIALAGVVNLFNPEIIVIGGGVANAGKPLFERIREVISERAMSVQAQDVKVVKAKLGNEAGMIGAAILAREGFKKTK